MLGSSEDMNSLQDHKIDPRKSGLASPCSAGWSSTEVKTLHVLALQTSYVSQTGDATANAKFPVAEKIHTWPFLTGVDVEASARGAAIVAFGSSLTDGDGTESDSNGRWPDVLAQQLQKSSGGKAELGVLNEGIIGNRLLNDSPMGSGRRSIWVSSRASGPDTFRP